VRQFNSREWVLPDSTSLGLVDVGERVWRAGEAKSLLDPLKPVRVLVNQRTDRRDCIGKAADIALRAEDVVVKRIVAECTFI
jgi:hypothetical protein